MEVKVRATKLQIEEFKESILWEDIENELEQWKSAAQGEYSQVISNIISGGSGIENSDMHLGSLFGREMTIDYLLSIPDIFIQVLEERKEEKEKEDESRRNEA